LGNSGYQCVIAPPVPLCRHRRRIRPSAVKAMTRIRSE
jgi:hypothetical protein